MTVKMGDMEPSVLGADSFHSHHTDPSLSDLGRPFMRIFVYRCKE